MREGRWNLIVESLTRPYPVSIPMVVLVLLVPGYIFIADIARHKTTYYAPEIALDRVIPVQPIWSLVYGALYLFLIVLPVFVVRRPEHIRRTVYAYLAIWITAYVFFLLYPTVAPRTDEVSGEGFGAWGLRLLYSSDPPFNCFPSLHVAHSFVSALTCVRVHRGVGIGAVICAALVGVSTLFTRQHYVLDVVAGIVLAFVAWALFLRRDFNEDIAELDRRAAPVLALGILAVLAVVVACFWIAYRLGMGGLPFRGGQGP